MGVDVSMDEPSRPIPSEGPGRMKVMVSPRAAKYVMERGGRLYVWVSAIPKPLGHVVGVGQLADVRVEELGRGRTLLPRSDKTHDPASVDMPAPGLGTRTILSPGFAREITTQ
jgi:hypothetical protein